MEPDTKRLQTYETPDVTVTFNRAVCRPQVARCPSGALQVIRHRPDEQA